MIIGGLEHAVRVGAYDGVSETTFTAEYVYLLPIFLDAPMNLRRIAYQSQWADANGDNVRFGIYQSLSGSGNVNAMPSGSSGSNWNLVSPVLVGNAGSWLAASPSAGYVDFQRDVRLTPRRGSVYAVGFKASGGDIIMSGVDSLVCGHKAVSASVADSTLPRAVLADLNDQGAMPGMVLMSFDGARALYGSIPSRTVVG